MTDIQSPADVLNRFMGVRHTQPVDYPQLPKPTPPTPDYEADTERLLDDAYNLRSGPLRTDKLAEALVVATAWSANESRRIADALDTLVAANR
jgi:hypothetical protein